MPVFRNGVTTTNKVEANIPSFNKLKNFQQLQTKIPSNKLTLPGEGLNRYIHFCADQSGCGFWRMLWPAHALLAYNKAVVMTLYQMILDPNFYRGISAVRLQRQCTETQYQFIKHLRHCSNECKNKFGHGFKLIWEVDDLVCPVKDIPNYNKCKEAFTNPQILDTVKRIVHEVDEITTVSYTMKDHYKKWLSYDKISVLPNYYPKTWLDGFFSKTKLLENYLDRKKKRIGYAGSGTHFDVARRAGNKDDFSHVVDEIIKQIDNYEWYFIGGYPLKLKPYIDSKRATYVSWGNIMDHPTQLANLNLNIMIAPLEDNIFNRSKSSIKLLEAGALGLPCVCQDLPCYDVAPYRFTTSEEMFDHIEKILYNEDTYMDAVKKSRELAEKYWLEDHLNEYNLIYNTPFGDKTRKDNKNFLQNNEDQFTLKEVPKIKLN